MLVGHSFGGFLIRVFAAEHPEDVAGLVFVDSSHEDAFADEANQAEVAGMRTMLRVLQAATRLGVLRVYNPVAEHVDGLPNDALARAVARQVRSDHAATARAEADAILRVADHLRASDADLGDLPLRVLTAGDNDVLAPYHPGLAELSTEGRHEVVADAGHITLITEKQHAAEVSATVSGLLEDLRR